MPPTRVFEFCFRIPAKDVEEAFRENKGLFAAADIHMSTCISSSYKDIGFLHPNGTVCSYPPPPLGFVVHDVGYGQRMRAIPEDKTQDVFTNKKIEDELWWSGSAWVKRWP